MLGFVTLRWLSGWCLGADLGSGSWRSALAGGEALGAVHAADEAGARDACLGAARGAAEGSGAYSCPFPWPAMIVSRSGVCWGANGMCGVL